MCYKAGAGLVCSFGPPCLGPKPKLKVSTVHHGLHLPLVDDLLYMRTTLRKIAMCVRTLEHSLSGLHLSGSIFQACSTKSTVLVRIRRERG